MNDSIALKSICCNVLVDGQPLSATQQISVLQVVLHADQESVASITINESSQATDQIHFPQHIKPAANVEVMLGYEQDSICVFSGELMALEAQVSSGVGTLVVLNALADTEYSSEDKTSLCLTYGETLLDFNGVVHFEEQRQPGSEYPAEVELTVAGNAAITPNQWVSLKNCSQWFDGDFQVLTVSHRLENECWLTQLVVSR